MGIDGYMEKLYIVLEEDEDDNNPYREKVYGYFLDPKIARDEVVWLKGIGVKARISISAINTRRL